VPFPKKKEGEIKRETIIAADIFSQHKCKIKNPHQAMRVYNLSIKIKLLEIEI